MLYFRQFYLFRNLMPPSPFSFYTFCSDRHVLSQRLQPEIDFGYLLFGETVLTAPRFGGFEYTALLQYMQAHSGNQIIQILNQ